MVLPNSFPNLHMEGPRLSSASLLSESERYFVGSPDRDRLQDLVQIHDWCHIEEGAFDVFDFVSLVRASSVGLGDAECDRVVLPPTRYPSRRTLVLDMDDTLTVMTFERVRDSLTGELREYDTIVTAQDNPEDWGMVYFRPYLRTFLEAVSKTYEVVLFTAACKEYADQILNAIDPENRLFHHRLYRDSCQECMPNPSAPDAKVYIKDLRVLGRALSDVILIDNSLLCFAYQLDNGIVCNPFKGASDDRELVAILEVLSIINKNRSVDVRKIFRKMYGLPNVIDEYANKGGRMGIRRGSSVAEELLRSPPFDEKLFDEGDFLCSPKSTATNTPAGKHQSPKSQVKYPKSGIRTSARHYLEPDEVPAIWEPAPSMRAPLLAAPPIFINTILPRLEPAHTSIETLYTSLIKNKDRS